MDGMHFTFTTLALIVLVVILLLMFVCHFLGARNGSGNGLCSSNGLFGIRHNGIGNGSGSNGSTKNKEKIGLSAASKLFHANGYVLHSGSEFLLSTSGSFKRFDTVDKEDHSRIQQQQQQQHQLQQQQLQQQAAAANQQTTPLWNLPQQHIPPQPLRPAPQAPDSAGLNKTVTFSFRNEVPATATTANSIAFAENTLVSNAAASSTALGGKTLVSCMKSTKGGKAIIPQLINPPPPAAATSASSMLSNGGHNNGGTAIPRPLGLRQSVTAANTAAVNENKQQEQLKYQQSAVILSQKEQEVMASVKDMYNTNPFLCEVTNDDEAAAITTTTAENIIRPEEPQQQQQQQQPPTAMNGGTLHKNPFLGDIISTHEPFIPQGANGQPQSNLSTESHSFRNRSFSETEDELKSLTSRLNAAGSLLRMHGAAATSASTARNPFNELKQKMKGPHLLQKTISEDFLFRKLPMNMNGGGSAAAGAGGCVGGAQQHHSLGGGGFRHAAHVFLRQNSTVSLSGFGQRTNSQCSLDSMASMDSINLMHGISCDSVDSDSSSAFISSLDQTYTQITGYLRVGLHYDKNGNTPEGMALTVSVLEAKGLICPLNVPTLDTFVRIYLVPDQAVAMQTEVFYNSETPLYNESFDCWLKKQSGGRHSLWFHLYHSGEVHTLIGEAEMEISEIPRPIITWIPLSDSRKCNAKWGELMFSLSYLPTAERLTIVIVKARNLKREICTTHNPQPQKVHSVFVKVYLMNNEKKVLKKRTTLKRCDRGTIFNEAMIFSVPPHGLTTVQLRLTVFGLLESDGSSGDGTTPQSHSSGHSGSVGGTHSQFVTLGHVIAGSCSTGKGLRHWHQMLSSLRKPVAMWHVLRAAANQPIFTGGAEAVVEALQQCNTLRTKRNSVY